MKKILLSIALAAFAFSASAQFIVSANIGGSMFSGDTNIHTQISVVSNEESSATVYPVTTGTFTAGLKLGYKFGKAQAGIAGSYSMYNLDRQPLDPTIVPMISSQSANWTSTGEMKSHGASYTIAPYFRYDVITSGDIALFLELNAFYTVSMNPTVDECHVTNTLIPSGGTIQFLWDTTNVVVPRTSTSYGVKVTPGLSWQLSKHCGIDLYFDFLSLAYSHISTSRIDMNYKFQINGMGVVEGVAFTPTTTTSSSSSFSGGLTGTPILTEQGVNNWVRVGFNFTF